MSTPVCRVVCTQLILFFVLVLLSDAASDTKSDAKGKWKLFGRGKNKELIAKMKQNMKIREDAFNVWLTKLNDSVRYDRKAYIAGIIALAVCSPVLWILSIIFFCMGAGTKLVQQKNTMSASLLSQPEMPKTRKAAPVPVQLVTKSTTVPSTSIPSSVTEKPPMLHQLPQVPNNLTMAGLRNQSPTVLNRLPNQSPTVLNRLPNQSPTVLNRLPNQSPTVLNRLPNQSAAQTSDHSNQSQIKIIPPFNSSPTRLCHRQENEETRTVGSPSKLPPKLSPGSVQTRVNL